MTRSTNPRRAAAVAALAVAAALTLGACANSAEPGADPTTQGPTAQSPSATPSATPSSTPADPTSAPSDDTSTNTLATPVDGSTVAGPQVEVTGEGTAFEGNLSWRVVTAGTTEVVSENFTTGGANGTIGPFSFTVDLPPGSYTVEVWEPGASDGGGEGASDSRRGLVTSTFTVT